MKPSVALICLTAFVASLALAGCASNDAPAEPKGPAAKTAMAPPGSKDPQQRAAEASKAKGGETGMDGDGGGK